MPEKLESNLIVSTTINWEARKVIGTYGGSIFGNLEREMNYCEGAIESESDFNVQRRQSPFFWVLTFVGLTPERSRPISRLMQLRIITVRTCNREK